MQNGRFKSPNASNGMRHDRLKSQNVADSMENDRLSSQNVAHSMQTDRLRSQHAANSMWKEMENGKRQGEEPKEPHKPGAKSQKPESQDWKKRKNGDPLKDQGAAPGAVEFWSIGSSGLLRWFAWQAQNFLWPGVTFAWQTQYFTDMNRNSGKTHWYELHSPFLKEDSSCFRFHVVNFENKLSLAG